MNLNVMLITNYNDIALRAKRITQRQNPGKHNDLINSTYLRIHDESVPIPDNNDGFVRFFAKCMKNTYIFSKSPFNEIHRQNFNQEELTEDPVNEDVPIDLDISKCKNHLKEHEQILFELHFEKGITYRRIAQLYTGDGYRITIQSIHAMIKNIRNKIKKIHYEGCY